MLFTKAILFIITIQLSATRGDNERETNYNSVLNFILEIRNNSSTVWEYVATIQALLCPEQPVCTRDGIQDRNATLSALPSTLSVGTERVQISAIPEFVGICCLPCSCSENCQRNGYCCMSREVLFNEKAPGEKSGGSFANDTSDGTLLKVTSSDALINDVSDSASVDDRSVDMLLNNVRDNNKTMAGKIGTTSPDPTLDGPVESECVAASLKAYLDKNYIDPFNNYFMVTRCFKDNTNDTLNGKCQHPRYDRLDETTPITSLKTNQTYWNMYCAICNKDADDVIQWTSVVNLSPEFYYFANSSRPRNFPQTVEELHIMLATSYHGITYTPTTAVEDNVCLPKNNLKSCTRYADIKAVSHKASVVNDCSQFYTPVTFNIQGLIRSYMNPFCIFCDVGEILPARNTGCAEKVQGKGHGGMVSGLLDYRKEQNSEETAAGQDLKEGKCRCTEIEDPYQGMCRPAFCAAGDIWMKCRCAQPIKSFSGIPVRLILKLIPEIGRIDVTTETQIRKLKMAMTRFLQNTVENTKAEIVAIFHMESESSEYLLPMVTLRSNPGHDTKQTMKPLMKYLDKKSTHGVKIGQTRYAIQFTTSVLVWTEYVYGEGMKLRVNDLDADGAYNMSTYQLDASALHVVQPLSPLLYCKQIQLNASEYTETDGQVNINTTSPTFSLPYYYRIDPKQVRVCLSHYLHRSTNQRKSNGTATNHAFKSITGLIMLLILSVYGIV